MAAPIRDAKRLVMGLSLSVVCVGIFFWWGLHFEAFGKRLSNDLPTAGFFTWIALAAGGFGYAVGGWRSAIKWAGIFVAMFAAAGLLGKALGNYE